MTELQAGWNCGWSAQHNSWYYFNSALAITQWNPPSPVPLPHVAKTTSLVSACYDDNGDDDDDEEEKMRGACPSSKLLYAEDKDPQYAASVALAQELARMDLAAIAARKQASSKGCRQNAQTDAIRRHLFAPMEVTQAVPERCTSGLSYAQAANRPGNAEVSGEHQATGTAHRSSSSQPNLASCYPGIYASRVSPKRCDTVGKSRLLPEVIFDGANIAFRYGEANQRSGDFCARGVRCDAALHLAHPVSSIFRPTLPRPIPSHPPHSTHPPALPPHPIPDPMPNFSFENLSLNQPGRFAHC